MAKNKQIFKKKSGSRWNRLNILNLIFAELSIILVLLVILLLFTGCSDFLPNNTKINYRTGTEGVKVEIKGPDDLLAYSKDNSTYPEMYTVTLTNNGAEDVKAEDLYLKISVLDNIEFKDGYMDRSLSLDKNFFSNILHGKSQTNNKGESLTSDFTIRGLPIIQGSDGKIVGELCYKYKTTFSDSICVETKVLEDNKGCKRKDYTYNGQGGPILVSGVSIKNQELDSNGLKVLPRLDIAIKNSENEFVSLPDNYNEGCTRKRYVKYLKMKATLGGRQLSCNDNNDTIELVNGERSVLCELSPSDIKETELGYFTSPLIVELAYGYHQQFTKDVNLKLEKLT